MSTKKIILYSCGSDIITDFYEVCIKNNIEIKYILNNMEKENNEFKSIPVKGFDFTNEETPFLIPLFNPANRHQVHLEAIDFGLKPFDLLSDRNNDLPEMFSHGEGCFINKRVVIGSSSRFGNFVLINRGACLGHHQVLEDYVSVGGGVVTGGKVTIKYGTLIGTGAVLAPGVTIGRHAVVGAGAVVIRDVEDGMVVVGNPAKVIKENKNVF